MKKIKYFSRLAHQMSVMPFSIKTRWIAPLHILSNFYTHLIAQILRSFAWLGSVFNYFQYLLRIFKARLFSIISYLSYTESSYEYLRNPFILSFDEGDSRLRFSISNNNLGARYKCRKYYLRSFLMCLSQGATKLYSSSVSMLHILFITLKRKLLTSICSKLITMSQGKTTRCGNFLPLLATPQLLKYPFTSFIKYLSLISEQSQALHVPMVSIRSITKVSHYSMVCRLLKYSSNLFLITVSSTISFRYLAIFCLSCSDTAMTSSSGKKFCGF